MRFAREDAAATAFGVVAVGAYVGYLAFGGTPFIKHVESEAVFAVLIVSIVALRACRRPLGGPAADTPARSACRIEAQMPINHLIYAVPELRTAHELEERIGVRAERGSKYVGFGTHDVLLAPGAGTCLQIIAADREQPSPATPRPEIIGSVWLRLPVGRPFAATCPPDRPRRGLRTQLAGRRRPARPGPPR